MREAGHSHGPLVLDPLGPYDICLRPVRPGGGRGNHLSIGSCSRWFFALSWACPGVRALSCPLHSGRGDLNKETRSPGIGRGKPRLRSPCEKLVCVEPVAAAGDGVGGGTKVAPVSRWPPGLSTLLASHLFPM